MQVPSLQLGIAQGITKHECWTGMGPLWHPGGGGGVVHRALGFHGIRHGSAETAAVEAAVGPQHSNPSR
jgi:hypothetical protein